MIRIAVVEDEYPAFEMLNSYIERFGKTKNVELQVTHFDNADKFLARKAGSFDIVFMDIELPRKSGMDASRAMRRDDNTTVLIFVTNMAQYAIKGYEVDALDFIVKPVRYPSFEMKMDKALRHIEKAKDKFIVLKTKDGIRKIRISRISYVEVRDHRLYYHTLDETLDACGSLDALEKELQSYGFSRCNNCYLVNLDKITEILSSSIIIDGNELAVSRPRRKAFLEDFARRIGA